MMAMDKQRARIDELLRREVWEGMKPSPQDMVGLKKALML